MMEQLNNSINILYNIYNALGEILIPAKETSSMNQIFNALQKAIINLENLKQIEDKKE